MSSIVWYTFEQMVTGLVSPARLYSEVGHGEVNRMARWEWKACTPGSRPRSEPFVPQRNETALLTRIQGPSS